MKYTELTPNNYYYNNKESKIYFLSDKNKFKVVLDTNGLNKSVVLAECDLAFNEVVEFDWTKCNEYGRKLLSDKELLRNANFIISQNENKLREFSEHLQLSAELETDDEVVERIYDLLDDFQTRFEGDY